jgi:hypothetical protein
MKKILTALLICITFNLTAQTELNGGNGFNFGISKLQATDIFNKNSWQIIAPDDNTMGIFQNISIEGIQYTGVVLSFANNKLYGFSFTFNYSAYGSIKTKLSEKYGYKYEVEKITDTYTSQTWTFKNDNSIVLSMDFENKTGMLQFTAPDLLVN